MEMTDNAASVIANRTVHIHLKNNVLLEELGSTAHGDNGQVDKKKLVMICGIAST